MRLMTGLMLAGGLALIVAGCSMTHGGAETSSATPTGQAGAGAAAAPANASVAETSRDFNLRVRCPGVHELKSHGWTDAQIMQQLSVSEEEIPACEEWVKTQPKGYVPPPPAGYVPRKVAIPAAGVPAPNGSSQTTTTAPAAAASPATH